MDWRALPPLAALRAFAAYAECGSVVEAGARLGISHAAVSQQLRALERALDQPLLDRSGRALRLTGEGARLAKAVTEGFGGIAAAIEALRAGGETRPLHIATTANFAAYWLMPRLPAFRAAHPEIGLFIDPAAKMVALEPGGVDLALRYGAGDWPGLQSEQILRAPMVVVAAPSLIKGQEIRTPADLSQLPWLEEIGASEASSWLKTQGDVTAQRHGRITVPGNLLSDGARDGQGLAVMVRSFVHSDLQAGRLVALFEDETPDKGYYLVTRPEPLRPNARAFVQWIRREVRRDRDAENDRARGV